MIFDLCNTVRETAYAIHLYHGHGHLEKVYENALAHRLRKLSHDVKQQHAVTVLDEDVLVVELKAAKAIADEHIAQLLGYLKSTRLEHGLLINFGSYKFQIKKYAMRERSSVAEDF